VSERVAAVLAKGTNRRCFFGAAKDSPFPKEEGRGEGKRGFELHLSGVGRHQLRFIAHTQINTLYSS
jgi:hypothetical protein